MRINAYDPILGLKSQLAFFIYALLFVVHTDDFVGEVEIAAANEVGGTIVDYFKQNRRVEHIHRLFKRDLKFLRYQPDDTGILHIA